MQDNKKYVKKEKKEQKKVYFRFRRVGNFQGLN